MSNTLAILAILLGIACTPTGPTEAPPDASPAGLTGKVTDNAGAIVPGATVYLVPVADIPRAELALTDIVVERASVQDEPLEDPIRQHGADYPHAISDVGGFYHIASVPDGKYFVTVVPADDAHLPGGSMCRKSLPASELAGKQLDITVSSRPSANAEYIGSSVCLGCHGITHQRETLHMNGIRRMGGVAGLQDSRRYPNWDAPLARFSATGTTIYFFDFTASPAPTYKVSERRPAAGVSFSARLYQLNGAYFVDLTDLQGTSGTVTYPVEMSYGGGLYKQTYLVSIGGSRYVLPFAFQYQGQTDETQPAQHWVWAAVDAGSWYDERTHALRTPATRQSFDSACAGCHFSGFTLTGDEATGFRAHAAADASGEMDYDGDGKAEELNVTCESCHGPGSEHWFHAGAGNAIVSPQLLTPEREVVICAACHTRPAGFGGAGSGAPLDAGGVMPKPGISRQELLTSFVSRLDDIVWDDEHGDGRHAKGNYQQASEFLTSAKYRNETWLMTCAECHAPHGDNVGITHGLKMALDDASTGPGLCLSCHDADIPAPWSSDLEERMKDHYAAEGVIAIPKAGVGCADCHATKTAISAAGTQLRTIDNVTYFGGDITSHRFDVPTRSSIQTKTSEMMAIPYTSTCGYCHIEKP